MTDREQLLDELGADWPAVAAMIQAIRESPDFLVGDRSIRLRQQGGASAGDLIPSPPVEPYRPPFTLETFDDSGTLKLRCYYGRIGKTSMLSDSGAGEVFAFNYVNTTIGGLDLADHPAPIAGTEGALTLSASTTYGVWIKVDVRKSSWQPYTAPGSDTVNSTLVEFSTAHASSIVIDSTHTAESQAATLTGTTSGFAYIYIGKVVVDGSSVATITQHLRSDVLLPATLYPHLIISSDADNSLGNGSDGGIYVRTVSGDTDNSITPGSDGGAYLADDAFMTGLTATGDVSVSDNGNGTWDVSYTEP